MAASTGNGYEPNPIADALMRLNPKLSVSKAKKIASAIRETYYENDCVIPWQIIVSIAFHESTFKIDAVNPKSKDYGFMQISKSNISRMNLDKSLLMSDYKYSLKVACSLISYNHKKYSKKLKYWIGIYRSGTALHKKEIRDNAIQYDAMIRGTAEKIGYRSMDYRLAKGK